MIRIMLVDDQRFARLGFQLMLDDASDIVVTAQSADGRPPSRRSNSSPFSIVHCRM